VVDAGFATMAAWASHAGEPDAPRPWEPLDNDPTPDPVDAASANAYAARRAAMIAALASCDRVLAVSRFVRDKFHALGVPPGVLSVLPIGTRMTDLAASCPELRSARPPAGPGEPVRLVFMGYHNFYKGLPLLLDALPLVPASARARLHLSVYAKGVESMADRLERVRSGLAGLRVRGEYRYEDVPEMLAGKDLGLVPSVWWDNGPQTVMEFLACGVPVLGARLGGIPDWIDDGHNGLLHTGCDPRDLAAKLSTVAAEPGMLAAMRANIRPPVSMSAHAAALEDLYAGLRAGVAP
jgi:glycosyltransferase involved in cell wall biosynthesis